MVGRQSNKDFQKMILRIRGLMLDKGQGMMVQSQMEKADPVEIRQDILSNLAVKELECINEKCEFMEELVLLMHQLRLEDIDVRIFYTNEVRSEMEDISKSEGDNNQSYIDQQVS
ncbi:unnamed protein product [Ilex paraguariensis]|uniref:Uncharacterized protein n=1 Tax=Ilex paraguariensis TaxID=185542 RepID=A0ABC8SZD0_9AQUA